MFDAEGLPQLASLSRRRGRGKFGGQGQPSQHDGGEDGAVVEGVSASALACSELVAGEPTACRSGCLTNRDKEVDEVNRLFGGRDRSSSSCEQPEPRDVGDPLGRPVSLLRPFGHGRAHRRDRLITYLSRLLANQRPVDEPASQHAFACAHEAVADDKPVAGDGIQLGEVQLDAVPRQVLTQQLTERRTSFAVQPGDVDAPGRQKPALLQSLSDELDNRSKCRVVERSRTRGVTHDGPTAWSARPSQV